MLIGLMGKSGSGKTTIGDLIKEMNQDIQILDIDKIGHKSHEDKEVKAKLLEYFGPCILNEDTSVNRKKLSTIVFNDSSMMKKLYDATYEFMQKEIDRLIQNADVTVLDYALLPITKYYNLCDVTILVKAAYDKRSLRVTKRDCISKQKYDEIDSNSVDYSNMQFDFVIENNMDIDYLRKVVGEIYEKSIFPGQF